MNHFKIFFNIIILAIINKLSSLSYIDSSFILPIKKIFLTEDINRIDSTKSPKYDLDSIGYGITFNNTSNISLIPLTLFQNIKVFYKSYEDIVVDETEIQNGNKEMILYVNIDYGLETLFFIFENFGISIPLKYFLIEKDMRQKYGIRFQTNAKQEYITFGKDLIDIMDIEFNDNYNLIINNEEFLIKFDE